MRAGARAHTLGEARREADTGKARRTPLKFDPLTGSADGRLAGAVPLASDARDPVSGRGAQGIETIWCPAAGLPWLQITAGRPDVGS